MNTTLINQRSFLFNPDQGAEGGMSSGKSLILGQRGTQSGRGCAMRRRAHMKRGKAQDDCVGSDLKRARKGLALASRESWGDTLAYETGRADDGCREGGFVQRQCI